MGTSVFCSRRDFFKATLAGVAAWGVTHSGDSSARAAEELLTRAQAIPAEHPLSPAIKLAQEGLTALAPIDNYQAILVRRERIGNKLLDSRIELKIRENPFSVYLKFQQPSAGREALYVAGKNQNNVLAHDVGFAGLAGTLELDPKGSFAMDQNRHPITMIGLRNMVTSLLEQWVNEANLGGATVKVLPATTFGKVVCRGVEVSYSQAKGGLKFQTTRLYVDDSTSLPVRVQAYDFPGRRDKEPPLAEDYFYTELKTNIGLAENDFSTRNPKYRF
ncbi:DUF1571 domain-containing protein [Planctomicrobium sp. SH664]|uniref:DUF1571 domain-containing protein n=1 Tax=Planctomicrobium sp. SH664 TaxID=3448125 RepID=UPI003F5B84AE